MDFKSIEILNNEQAISIYNDILEEGTPTACGCYWYVRCDDGVTSGVGFQPWGNCTTYCSAPDGTRGSYDFVINVCPYYYATIFRNSPYSAG